MTQYAFNDLNFSSPDRLPSADLRSGERIAFLKAIQARPSTMFRSAAESIDAAISLLALGQLGQALMLLTQAAEVSLKGILHEISLLGTSTWAAQNPVLFRNLARSGQVFDEQSLRESLKTKTFISTLKEVNGYLSFSNRLVDCHYNVNSARNDVAHHGGYKDQYNIYLAQIIGCLLALLDEFYTKALGNPISNLLCHAIARELIVAMRYLRLHMHESDAWSVALRPLEAAYFSCWQFVEVGTPRYFEHINDLRRYHNYDDDDKYEWKKDFEWEKKVAESLDESVSELMDTLEDVPTHCRICGGRCFLATDGVLKWNEAVPYLEVSSMACVRCHLTIPEKHADLARLHYGPIDEQLLGREEWVKVIRRFGHGREILENQ